MSNLPFPTSKMQFDMTDCGGVEASMTVTDCGTYLTYTAKIGFGRIQIQLDDTDLDHFHQILDDLQHDLMLLSAGAKPNAEHLCLGRDVCGECREDELAAQAEALGGLPEPYRSAVLAAEQEPF